MPNLIRNATATFSDISRQLAGSDPADVVVVGAGLAGLACALSCNLKGLRVLVLERDASRTYRRQGFNLWVPEKVLATLRDDCGVEPGEVACMFTCDFDTKGHMPLLASTRESKHGPPGISTIGAVRRGELRNKMLDACEQRGVRVKFDAALENIGECDDGMRILKLSCGNSVKAKCIVGCDGIHSKVRAFVAPEAKLETCGSLCLRGAGPDDGSVRKLAGMEQSSVAPALMWVSAPPGIALNMTIWGGRLTWVFEFKHTAPLSLTAAEAHEMMVSFTKDWHPILRNALHDNTDTIHLEPLQDLGSWGGSLRRDNVILCGDAAHPMVWTGGGGNAVLDGVALAHSLVSAGLPLKLSVVPDALLACERIIRERVPAEQAMKVRELLPSLTGGGREDKFVERERLRQSRWEKMRGRTANL